MDRVDNMDEVAELATLPHKEFCQRLGDYAKPGYNPEGYRNLVQAIEAKYLESPSSFDGPALAIALHSLSKCIYIDKRASYQTICTLASGDLPRLTFTTQEMAMLAKGLAKVDLEGTQRAPIDACLCALVQKAQPQLDAAKPQALMMLANATSKVELKDEARTPIDNFLSALALVVQEKLESFDLHVVTVIAIDTNSPFHVVYAG